MSSDSIEASALAQLQSKQKDLLDDIDKLRDAGLGRYIPLPQLVVVGDQSSGKSSVLEAISRVRFPTESGICTRFATQVALRRAPATAISVSIRPGDSRKDTTERAQLEAFQHNFNDESQLPAMVSQAKEAMGIGRAGRSFSDDILSVEVTGPDKPHLTLVDLPGLIRDADSQTDITLVKRLVESYMRESKSIILAIVAANYDTANQEVLNLIRQMDPVGTRTLGIVTKPDRLEPEQDDERNCVKLIQNERTFLRLGWHVVRNRSDATRKATDQERDDAEMAFLSNRIWTQIDRKHKGAESLRSRLSDVLLHQISSNLSDLIADIKNQLNDSKERLSKLGEPRETAKQQRNHLLNISSKFQNLVQNSNEGRYIEDFSSVVTQSDWPVKRLRAAIERNNRRFAEEMHQRGHRRQVYESLLGSSFGVPSLSPWSTESYEQKFLTRHTLAAELDDDAVRLRDRSLPGFPNSHLVSHLFKDQSKPWHVLAAAHVLACYNAARRTVRLALAHVANEDVCERISRQVIEPWLFERKKAMDNMLSLVAKPLLRNDPMTYNPVYELKTTNQFRAAQRGNLKNNLSNGKPDSIQESEKNFSWNDIQVAQSKETSSTKLATSLDIITKTEAYYEIAMNAFIDNVCIFVIEHCLLDELRTLLNHEVVGDMDDPVLSSLAAESSAAQEERKQLTKKVDTLAKGLQTCSQYEVDAVISNQADAPKVDVNDPDPKPAVPLANRPLTSSGTELGVPDVSISGADSLLNRPSSAPPPASSESLGTGATQDSSNSPLISNIFGNLETKTATNTASPFSSTKLFDASSSTFANKPSPFAATSASGSRSANPFNPVSTGGSGTSTSNLWRPSNSGTSNSRAGSGFGTGFVFGTPSRSAG